MENRMAHDGALVTFEQAETDRTTNSAQRGIAISPIASSLSLAAAATSLVLLAALHGLSPEFDPSWRMVSEYALGDFGWVLALMFLSMALSCVALFLAIKSQIRTIGGKIGLGFLLAAVVGMAMGSVFDITHSLHAVAALIGNPGMIIAALLISVSLSRNPAWSPLRRRLLWTAQPPWIFFALMLTVLFVGLSRTGGEFGPDVPIGWPNRLLMLAYGVWLMVVAWRPAQLIRDDNERKQLYT